MPSMTWPSARSASMETRRASTSAGAVTRDAMVRVVPWSLWKAAARLAACSSPSVKEAPPPPCTCMSMKPGSAQWPRMLAGCAAACPGESPWPMASMTAPATLIQPGETTPSGVTTWSAAMITPCPVRRPAPAREDHRAGQGARVVGVDALAGGQRDREALRPGEGDERVPGARDDQGAGAGGVPRQGLRDVADPPHDRRGVADADRAVPELQRRVGLRPRAGGLAQL